MQELTLTTPSLLFSAVITYPIGLYKPVHFVCKPRTHIERKASTDTRPEKRRPDSQPQETVIPDTLHANIRLLSLLFCVVSMFFIYISWQIIAAWIFGIGLLLLAASLCVCIWEINISVNALEIHLQDMSSK